MSMNERSRDWSDLSAYLDGEMTGREKAILEQRLQKNTQLCGDLNRMKATRAMLRSLPRCKVPHDFILTAEMAKNRQKSAWLPLFGYASIASALIAMVLLLVQFLPASLLNKSSLQAAVPAAEMAMESTARDQADGPQIIYWGGVKPPDLVAAEGKGGGFGGGAADTPYIPPAAVYAAPLQQEAPLNETVPSVEATGAPEAALMQVQPTASSETTAGADEGVLTRQAETPTEEILSAEPETLMNEGEETGPILGLRSPEEGNEMTFPDAVPTQPAEKSIPSYMAYIFLGLATLTGAAAYFFWRKPR